MNKDSQHLIKQFKISDEIWMKQILPNSIFALADKIEMPGNGVGIQKVTGQPEAEWVIGEGAEKPVKDHVLGEKYIQPYEIAVIETFSDNFLEDEEKLANLLENTLVPAILKKAARTFYGVDAKPTSGGSPVTNMDTFADVQALSFNSNVYDAVSDLECFLAEKQYPLAGYILSPKGKRLVRGCKDNNGRPIFIDTPHSNGAIGDILGVPVHQDLDVYKAGAATGSVPELVGIAGDFKQAKYGLPSTIELKISDSATLNIGGTMKSMFQTDQVAVRAKARFGFGIMDNDAFRRITGAIPTTSAKKEKK